MTATLATSTHRIGYERDGFVIARSLFTPAEMRDAAAEADSLLADYKHLQSVRNLRCRWQDNVFTGECTFETFDPVIDLAPVCRSLALHPRLLDLLAASTASPRACSRTSSSTSRRG